MAFATRDQVLQNIAKGLGYLNFAQMVAPSATVTAAAANSGYFTLRPSFNAIGTTLPSTLVGIQPPSALPTNLQIVMAHGSQNNASGCVLCLLYEIGTCTLNTAAGNNFTHHAATFPITRTQFGSASQPLSLIPVMHITTATTTTAAILRIRTEVPGNGYTNQDGTGVTGNIDFTMPNVATAVNSTFVMRLNQGDSAVRDINAIDVTTAASAGDARIFGMEILAPLGNIANINFTADCMLNGLHMVDIKPGSATSGTATVYLAAMAIGSTTAGIDQEIFIMGVLNS